MGDEPQVRGLLKDSDLTARRLDGLIMLAARLKSMRQSLVERPVLAGRIIALIFDKPSTRTRAAFEVAAYSQGAQVSYFGPGASHLHTHESVADTAAVLGRLYNGIAYRGSEQGTVETLGRYAGVPVWNALTSLWHPTQALADLLTIRDHCRKPWAETCVAFVGNGRSNVVNSLRVSGALLGMTVRVVAPGPLSSSAEVRDIVEQICGRTGGGVEETDDIHTGVRGADFIYADTWIHLGEPVDSWRTKVTLLNPYRIDANILAATKNPDVKFLHCMPAVHDSSTAVGAAVLTETCKEGAEVSDEVFRGPASLVFDQAENRMHAIKALLISDLTDTTSTVDNH